jgi:hypothetical protein
MQLMAVGEDELVDPLELTHWMLSVLTAETQIDPNDSNA